MQGESPENIMALRSAPDETERPPGKPDGMAAELFAEQVSLLVSARTALQNAAGVGAFRLWLNADARLCGSARLPDWRDSDGLDDALADSGLTLDAPPETPAVADGGERTDSAVDVRFSAEAPRYER